MKILFVTLNFYPDLLGNAPIVTDLAARLARRGHDVTVLTSMPHHETGRIHPDYRRRLWRREVHQGVKVHRIWLATGEGGLMKLANYASFTLGATAAAALLSRPDVIFSPSPPITLGLVDSMLRAFEGVPFVFNLQDVFPDVAVRMGVLTNRKLVKLFELVEAHTYRRAYKVAVISGGMADLLVDKGVPRSKIAVIPNAVDLGSVVPQERSELRSSLGLDGKFVVGFSGRMGYSQGLEHVIDAADLLAKSHPEIRLLLTGSGAQRAAIEARARDYGLGNVHFLPTQPRERLSDTLAASDLHLVPLRKGLASYSVPSKLLGIMAAGRPVVGSLDEDSDAAGIIRDAGCGVVVPPEDPRAIADAIVKYAGDRDLGRRQGAAGREYVEAHFDPEQMAERYEALFHEVIARHEAERALS